jgi:hypothetical protein
MSWPASSPNLSYAVDVSNFQLMRFHTAHGINILSQEHPTGINDLNESSFEE